MTTNRRRAFSVVVMLALACDGGVGGTGNGNDGPPGGSAAGPGTPGGTGTGAGGVTPGGAAGGPANPGFPAGCVANTFSPPTGMGCTAACSNCECTTIKYTCDKSCYAAQSNCFLGAGPDGTARPGGSFASPGCGPLSCTPENDLTKELTCTASGCMPPPPVMTQAVNVNRQPAATGTLFTMDTSGSMEAHLVDTACAAKSFTDAASAGGAKWSVGTMTMDMVPWVNYSSGAFTAPTLAQVSGACTTLACMCPSTASNGGSCNFTDNGRMINSTDANAVETLKQHMILGTYQQTGDEETLERAMYYVWGLWKQGRKTELGMVFAVSDEEIDSDGVTCQLNARRPAQVVQFREAMGPAFNPPLPDPALSCIDNLANWYIYFFNYANIIVHALVDVTGQNERGTGYIKVAMGTGGRVGDLFDCASYPAFFGAAGTTSATLSTNICFPQAIMNPATLKVTYTEGGQMTLVPRSTTDGWEYDAMLKCIVFSGSWKTRYGNFQIAYQ